MPDVSILQTDTELQVKESKIPGFFMTASVLALLVSIGAYIGLFFYNKILLERLSQLDSAIENLNIEAASTKVEVLNKIEGQVNILKKLRSEHTNANEIFDVLAKTIHPRVYYKSAKMDLKNKVVEVQGQAFNPASLSRQVSIYTKSEKIQKYKISNVKLKDGGVSFLATLNIN